MRHTRTGAFAQYRLSSLHRNASPIAQATAILARYGGSLWVADPSYVFTGSDGTGAASDGSDAGYVLDLCGNARPLTQATTSFKPKLRRVPKKLGAELVTNGDFATASDWTLGAGLAISSGALQVNASGGATTNAGVVVAGKAYAVTFDVTAYTSGSVRPFIGSVGGTAANSAGRSSSVVTPTGTGIQLYVTSGSTVLSVDNFSVREVLEWGWAWVFDGTDDTLATVAQPSVASETLVVAKQVNVLPTSGGTAITRWATPANTGSLLYANTSSATAMRVGTGTALAYLSANNPVLTPVVQSGVFAAQSRHRINGVQSATNNAGFTSNTTPINVGGYTGLFVNQNIYAAAYAPVALTDAELLIVERAMAQLAGVTI